MTVVDQRTAPRKQPRQRRSAETRERILEAAAHVFAERGYASGTMNHIAAEAGLSVGSLYQYFPNKDSILVELCRVHVREGSAAVVAAMAGATPTDLDGWLHLVVSAMVANHTDQPRLHQVLFEEAPRPPELLAELHDLEAWAISMAEEVLAGLPEVGVDDVSLAARMAVTTIESLTHRFIAREGPDLDVDAFVEQMVAMLGGYLRGSARASTRGAAPA